MRIQLSSLLSEQRQPVLFTYANDGIFATSEFYEQGFTFYDVIVIGGSGGRGGNVQTGDTYLFGGGGGGGGCYRKKALLEELPEQVEIVVGLSGPVTSGNGVNGGTSMFGDIAVAGGGEGGKAASSSFPGAGGHGGIGNNPAAGNGVGAEITGGWSGEIGSGGGGGTGGACVFDGTNYILQEIATSGGGGSFDDRDASVADVPGHPVQSDPAFSNLPVWPGVGGGANVAPFTGTKTIYGSQIATWNPNFSSGHGFVAVMLT